MINAIGNFVPTSFAVNQPALVKASELQRASVPVKQEILLTFSSQQFFFGDKLSVPFLLSPSDFSDTFGNITSSFFSDILPQLASASYAQSSLLNTSRLSILT